MQALLANDGKVEDEEGVLVLLNVDGVVISPITGGDFDLQNDDLRRVSRVGEDDDCGSTTFADDLS